MKNLNFSFEILFVVALIDSIRWKKLNTRDFFFGRITENQLLIERMAEEKRNIESESLANITMHTIERNRAVRQFELQLVEERRQLEEERLHRSFMQQYYANQMTITDTMNHNSVLMQIIIAQRTAERDEARAEVARLSRFLNERTAERDDASDEVKVEASI